MPSQDDSSFPQRVRLERERLGLTQTDFGRLGGVSKMAQWQYEAGKHWPTLEYIENLRASGEVDVVYLVTGGRASNSPVDWSILRNAFLLVQRSFVQRPGQRFTVEELFDVFKCAVETAMGVTRPDLVRANVEAAEVSANGGEHDD